MNHLSQAASSILRNPDLVSTLFRDWTHVDLNGIREQAGWIIRAKDTTISYVDASFRAHLSDTRSGLHVWVHWVEGMAEQCLSLELGNNNDTTQSMESAIRNLMHRWTFFGTMVIRDLTLRSAASFGIMTLFITLFPRLFSFAKVVDG